MKVRSHVITAAVALAMAGLAGCGQEEERPVVSPVPDAAVSPAPDAAVSPAPGTVGSSAPDTVVVPPPSSANSPAGAPGADRTASGAAPGTVTVPSTDATKPEAGSTAGTASTGKTAGTASTGKSGADRTAGQTVDDAAVTAKVKAALMAESGVDGTKINVDTTNGRVILKGEVASKNMIDRAVTVARGIEGVKDVDNRLTAGAG
jgi:hyperosmotically inducible periplasmic protein